MPTKQKAKVKKQQDVEVEMEYTLPMYWSDYMFEDTYNVEWYYKLDENNTLITIHITERFLNNEMEYLIEVKRRYYIRSAEQIRTKHQKHEEKEFEDAMARVTGVVDKINRKECL